MLEASSDARQGARHTKDLHAAYLQEGFTEAEALHLITALIHGMGVGMTYGKGN